jgi:hypothetical protein
MGYYTRFKAKVTGPQPLLERFKRVAEDSPSTFGTYSIPLYDLIDGDISGGEQMKWYDWKSDMEEVSSKFPSLLFILDGEGEESGDIWRAYFRDGKSVVQDAVLTYPEIDLDELLPYDKDLTEKVAKRELEERISLAMSEIESAREELARLTAEKESWKPNDHIGTD